MPSPLVLTVAPQLLTTAQFFEIIFLDPTICSTGPSWYMKHAEQISEMLLEITRHST